MTAALQTFTSDTSSLVFGRRALVAETKIRMTMRCPRLGRGESHRKIKIFSKD